MEETTLTKMSLKELQLRVSAHYGLHPLDIFAFTYHQNRNKYLSRIRQVFYLIAYNRFDYSLRQIGDFLCINHATVLTNLSIAVKSDCVIQEAEKLMLSIGGEISPV